MSVHDSARAEDEWAVMMSGLIKPPLLMPRQHGLTPGRQMPTPLCHAPLHLIQMYKVQELSAYCTLGLTSNC